jgi:hypothetical protein
MSRPVSLFLLGLLCVIASARAVAQSEPTITGTVNGVEVCPKPIPWCGGKSWFAGKFVGQVDQIQNATGSVLVGVGYVSLEDTNPGDPTMITGGDWLIVIKQGKREISGTILPFPESWLTYNGDKTFTASVKLQVSPPGNGVVWVKGILDHNGWPEITATLCQSQCP